MTTVHSEPDTTNDNPLGTELLGQLDEAGSALGRSASDLIGTALSFLGAPYHRGGQSAHTGFDCSGFVRTVYEKTVGLILPHRAAEQAAVTRRIDPSDLKPGDLVFFNTMKRAFSHVGIYLGDGKFIHSPRPGYSVRVDSMDMSYWHRHFNGARRVLDHEDSADPSDDHP